jgi:hypothetical protein
MTQPEITTTPPSTLPATNGEPARSSRWASTRRAFLRTHPRCAACADAAVPDPSTLNVHHVVPFHLVIAVGRPDLELDFRNLLTLCEGGEEHHLVVGHLGDWDSYNVHVVADAARPDCHGHTRRDIEALAWWITARANRPRLGSNPSTADRAQLRAWLDATYPPSLQPTPEARP